MSVRDLYTRPNLLFQMVFSYWKETCCHLGADCESSNTSLLHDLRYCIDHHDIFAVHVTQDNLDKMLAACGFKKRIEGGNTIWEGIEQIDDPLECSASFPSKFPILWEKWG